MAEEVEEVLTVESVHAAVVRLPEKNVHINSLLSHLNQRKLGTKIQVNQLIAVVESHPETFDITYIQNGKLKVRSKIQTSPPKKCLTARVAPESIRPAVMKASATLMDNSQPSTFISKVPSPHTKLTVEKILEAMRTIPTDQWVPIGGERWCPTRKIQCKLRITGIKIKDIVDLIEENKNVFLSLNSKKKEYVVRARALTSKTPRTVQVAPESMEPAVMEPSTTPKGDSQPSTSSSSRALSFQTRSKLTVAKILKAITTIPTDQWVTIEGETWCPTRKIQGILRMTGVKIKDIVDLIENNENIFFSRYFRKKFKKREREEHAVIPRGLRASTSKSTKPSQDLFNESSIQPRTVQAQVTNPSKQDCQLTTEKIIQATQTALPTVHDGETWYPSKTVHKALHSPCLTLEQLYQFIFVNTASLELKFITGDVLLRPKHIVKESFGPVNPLFQSLESANPSPSSGAGVLELDDVTKMVEKQIRNMKPTTTNSAVIWKEGKRLHRYFLVSKVLQKLGKPHLPLESNEVITLMKYNKKNFVGLVNHPLVEHTKGELLKLAMKTGKNVSVSAPNIVKGKISFSPTTAFLSFVKKSFGPILTQMLDELEPKQKGVSATLNENGFVLGIRFSYLKTVLHSLKNKEIKDWMQSVGMKELTTGDIVTTKGRLVLSRTEAMSAMRGFPQLHPMKKVFPETLAGLLRPYAGGVDILLDPKEADNLMSECFSQQLEMKSQIEPGYEQGRVLQILNPAIGMCYSPTLGMKVYFDPRPYSFRVNDEVKYKVEFEEKRAYAAAVFEISETPPEEAIESDRVWMCRAEGFMAEQAEEVLKSRLLGIDSVQIEISPHFLPAFQLRTLVLELAMSGQKPLSYVRYPELVKKYEQLFSLSDTVSLNMTHPYFFSTLMMIHKVAENEVDSSVPFTTGCQLSTVLRRNEKGFMDVHLEFKNVEGKITALDERSCEIGFRTLDRSYKFKVQPEFRPTQVKSGDNVIFDIFCQENSDFVVSVRVWKVKKKEEEEVEANEEVAAIDDEIDLEEMAFGSIDYSDLQAMSPLEEADDSAVLTIPDVFYSDSEVDRDANDNVRKRSADTNSNGRDSKGCILC